MGWGSEACSSSKPIEGVKLIKNPIDDQIIQIRSFCHHSTLPFMKIYQERHKLALLESLFNCFVRRASGKPFVDFFDILAKIN